MWEKSQIASNLLEEKYGDGKQKTLRLITSYFALHNRFQDVGKESLQTGTMKDGLRQSFAFVNIFTKRPAICLWNSSSGKLKRRRKDVHLKRFTVTPLLHISISKVLPQDLKTG